MRHRPRSVRARRPRTRPSCRTRTGRSARPTGTVDVPLAGTNVDAFEWKVDCGARSSSTPTSGTATITGEGTNRFTHRARDRLTGNWTDWVDDTVAIDSASRSTRPRPISSNWARARPTFPRHRHRRGLARRTPSGASTAAPGHLGATRHRHRHRHAHARHRGRRRRRQPQRGHRHRQGRQHAPGRHDRHRPGRLAAQARRPHGRRHRRRLRRRPRRVADRRAAARARGPDGTIVQHRHAGQHVFSTRVVDDVGNDSGWRSQDVLVDILGPIDTTVVPTSWYTTPTVHVNITGTDNLNRGITRIQWQLDGQPGRRRLQPGHGPGPGHRHRRRRPPARGPHHRRRRPTSATGTRTWSRSTPSPRSTTTTIVLRLAAARPRCNVTVHGTDAALRRSSASSGGSTAATSARRPATAHDVTRPGHGEHTLETRVDRQRRPRERLGPAHDPLDATAPTNLTPDRLRPAGATRPTRSCSTAPTRSPASPASTGSPARGPGRERRAHRAPPAIETRDGQPATARTRCSTRVRDVAGNYSGWRAETIQIDRVLPTDNTTYPSRRSATATSSPSTGRTTAPASPASSGSSTARAVKTTARRRSPAQGDHTLEVRVQDNAGNWSAWVDSHDHASSSRTDTDRADRHHHDPDAAGAPPPTRSTVAAADDIDGIGVDYVEWRCRRTARSRTAARRQHVHRHRGRRARDRDARLGQGRQPHRLAHADAEDRQDPARRTRHDRRPAGPTRRTITLQRDRRHVGRGPASSTTIDSGPSTGTINGATGGITLAGDGAYTISYTRLRRRRPAHRLEGRTTTRSTRSTRSTRAPRRRPPGRRRALARR